MAQKDFKKTRDDKYAQVWLHKKENTGVAVQISEGGLGEKYVVYYGDRDNASSKGFKTKQQALSFAKQYMRTH